MSRPARVLLLTPLTVAVSALAAACGTQRISVPKVQGPLYQGAVLFNQRCAGCHTLSYAATHGSAANVRTKQANNGPNFDVRCERPVARVLYAIENGGFSGAIMPQNVVVGQDARDVAQFVATYAGRQATKVVGTVPCASQPIETLPPPASATTTTSTSSTSSSTTSSTSSSSSSSRARHAKPKK
ncbi:MAG: cytochrome c, partial [Solirubrobacterales bacterium]|nr:cytochrome c [Solirubrobacterales bacterium]